MKNIVAGGHHTCALMDTGKVRCWGYNGYGQLGYGNTTNIGDNELPVGGRREWTSAATPSCSWRPASNHTCALLSTGNVRCWGSSGYGQLGYGNTGNIHAPATAGDVATGGQVLQVAAGKLHTCALLGTGDIKCWGNGASGRLGYGDSSSRLDASRRRRGSGRRHRLPGDHGSKPHLRPAEHGGRPLLGRQRFRPAGLRQHHRHR